VLTFAVGDSKEHSDIGYIVKKRDKLTDVLNNRCHLAQIQQCGRCHGSRERQDVNECRWKVG
jgi:hypothetical protein